jgi:hypothetical protein
MGSRDLGAGLEDIALFIAVSILRDTARPTWHFSQQGDEWHGRLQSTGILLKSLLDNTVVGIVTFPVSTGVYSNLMAFAFRIRLYVSRSWQEKYPPVSSFSEVYRLDGVEIVAELAQRADSRNRAEIREMQSAKLQLIYCHQSPSTSAVVRY